MKLKDKKVVTVTCNKCNQVIDPFEISAKLLENGKIEYKIQHTCDPVKDKYDKDVDKYLRR